MKRVMIVGGPGSGKSTLARSLSDVTGLPVFHMDHLHWKAGWVERARVEKVPMALEIEARPSWIFEGGLSATYDNRLARADTLVWLDLPVRLRLWRVMMRTFKHRGQSRPDLPEGCPEGMSFHTLAFFYYIWRTRQSHRVKLLPLKTRRSDVSVFHLRRPIDVERFLQHVKGQ